jgi:hypothetical protein
VVEPLPGYASELNPVEGLWSCLNGVELANLAGDTLDDIRPRPSVASSGSATPTIWPIRFCATAACPYGKQRPCHRKEQTSLTGSSLVEACSVRARDTLCAAGPTTKDL